MFTLHGDVMVMASDMQSRGIGFSVTSLASCSHTFLCHQAGTGCMVLMLVVGKVTVDLAECKSKKVNR